MISESQNTVNLQNYLDFAGILTCNVNAYLPSLSDIGCVWNDVTALIDLHALFYSKAYRKRTTYLSNSVYFLLKQCKPQKPMNDSARRIYDLLEKNGPMETETLKPLSGMESKAFSQAFDFLLENRYITAFQNGKVLNPNWSTFFYSTAERWETCVKVPAAEENPQAVLKSILTRTMPEAEFQKFISR